jgi:ATP synthase protein I
MEQMRNVIVWAFGLTVVCAVAAGALQGRQGVVGAFVGGAVVCAFFVSSPMALGPVTKVSPHLSLLVAMVFFVTKVVALVALFTVLLDRGGFGAELDRKSFGLTVIVTTIGWTFLQIRAARRQRVPLYDLGDTGH